MTSKVEVGQLLATISRAVDDASFLRDTTQGSVRTNLRNAARKLEDAETRVREAYNELWGGNDG